MLCLLGRLLFFNFCHNVISFFLKTFQSNELFEGKNTKLMKDKKLEANLSMVASRVMAGLNMNGLKFLLPLWLGALTGVTVRCVFAAVAFWITSWFVKEAPVTRRQRIGLFCLGAFGLYGFMFCYLLGISKTTPVSSAIFNSMQPIWVFDGVLHPLENPVIAPGGRGAGRGRVRSPGDCSLLLHHRHDLAHDAFTGNMLCMVSSLVFAVYLIVSKKLLEEVGVVTMMKYIFGGAAVTGLIVSSIIGWDAPLLTDALHGEWHWVPWAVLAFVLVFPTYLSYFLVPVGLKYLKTTVVAMYSYLILVVTTVVSLTLGQDRFSWTQAAAIAMICISVYFVEVAEAKK